MFLPNVGLSTASEFLTHITGMCLESFDALFQGAQERLFFLQHHVGNNILLVPQLWELPSHLLRKHSDKIMHERLIEAQEAVAVAYSPAQDPTDNISCPGVAGKLSIRDGETDRTQVVGDHTHGNVGLLFLVVLLSSCFCDRLDQWLEHIRIVIAALALQHHAQALEAHAGIHVLCRQCVQGAIALPFELHEHVVPDLDHVRVIAVHQFRPRLQFLFVLSAHVHMDLSAWTTRSGVAHFPKIVFASEGQDAFIRQVIPPEVARFFVGWEAVLFIAAEVGNVQLLRVDLVGVHE